MRIETSDIAGYVTAIPDEGMVITFFQDGDKPDTYVGAKKIHAQSAENFINLREITFAEHEAYLAAAEEYKKKKPEEEPDSEIIEDSEQENGLE